MKQNKLSNRYMRSHQLFALFLCMSGTLTLMEKQALALNVLDPVYLLLNLTPFSLQNPTFSTIPGFLHPSVDLTLNCPTSWVGLIHHQTTECPSREDIKEYSVPTFPL